MKKQRIILSVLWFTALLLAMITLLMGFVNFLHLQYHMGGVWENSIDISMFDIMTKNNHYHMTRWGILIPIVIFVTGPIITMIVMTFLNAFRKPNKKLNLGLTIACISCFIVSYILMMCIRHILGVNGEFVVSAIKYRSLPGSGGAIAWANLSLAAACFLGGSILVNKLVLKGQY